MENLNYSDFYQEYLKRFRDESGNIKSTNVLVAFLYYCLRDSVPAGVFEKAILDLEYSYANNGNKVLEHVFTNGFIAQYAQNISDRLVKLALIAQPDSAARS